MFLAGFWPVYQFLWTVYFIVMFLIGFWCIFMFFGVVIPMWLTEGLAEYFGKTGGLRCRCCAKAASGRLPGRGGFAQRENYL